MLYYLYVLTCAKGGGKSQRLKTFCILGYKFKSCKVAAVECLRVEHLTAYAFKRQKHPQKASADDGKKGRCNNI